MPLCQAPQGFSWWANQRCRGKRFPRLHSSRPAPRGSPQSWSSCIRLQHFNESDILEDGDGDDYAIGIIWQLTSCRVDCSWRHVQVTCSRGVGRIAVFFCCWKYENFWGNNASGPACRCSRCTYSRGLNKFHPRWSPGCNQKTNSFKALLTKTCTCTSALYMGVVIKQSYLLFLSLWTFWCLVLFWTLAMINWLSFGLESSSQASKLILTNTNSRTGGKWGTSTWG